ncbi:MAG: helix-hairpin-helix domain-containing protein [Anaerovoracaceae bacterium]
MGKYLTKEFLLENKDLVIKVATVILIIVAAFFVFILKNGGDGSDTYIAQAKEETSENGGVAEGSEGKEKTATIFVDICGEVKTATVAELPMGSRVIDAIKEAGGTKKSADLSSVNRAAFLNDGDKIIIPAKGEAIVEQLYGETAMDSTGGANKVSINTATSEELQTLNGVGPVTAEKILTYRKSQGSFKKIEELQNIDGIGEKTFEKLKDYIRI